MNGGSARGGAPPVGSLRRRLALWLLPALLGVLALSAVFAYRDARQATDAAFDRTQRVALGMLAADLRADTLDGAPDTARALAVLATADAAYAYVAVVDAADHSLAGENDLPLPRAAPGEAYAFADARYRGEPVRTASLRLAPADAGRRLILVESAAPRMAHAQRVFLAEMRRQALLAVAAIALAGIGLHGALHAIGKLAAALARRDAEDLTPLPPDAQPAELRPLTAAINAHMAALAALLEASRRFAADVAHQLRTPLTLLGAQAQYSLRQDDVGEIRRIVEGIVSATRGAQRLCNQMLSLSRAEAAQGALRDAARIDLGVLLRETALDLGVLAVEKRIDLAYAGGNQALPVLGNEIMLRELFSNLIDNALRYTPEGGRVTIAAEATDGQATVSVADSGPGIPEPARAAMFQRFHRRLDRGGTGSGLGLAIVHQVCQAHGGGVELADGESGAGLLVRVRLPLAPPADPAAVKAK